MNFLADTPRLELLRIAGIPVEVDITFALVPIFLFGVLQQSLVGFSVLVAGVFLSILLQHEFGHALFARLFGVPVGEILVGGFYGYAQMLAPPPSKLANIIILFAGPLTNGLIFLLCWNALGQPDIGLTGRFGEIDPAAWLDSRWKLHAVLTLGTINLAMLIFNLLPAFPLDGGRIYRDILGAFLSDKVATQTVALLGVIVGSWSAFIGFRIDLVLLLIGAQIAIINWSILKGPRPDEMVSS
ncbi:site-2 protease family protein [Hyphomicrobium sp.]|uniref:site-2 protease family protein n=1 Tax=Hyphomicrobium sp. TaxID=82 RepID=UPI002D77781D|nr:site-2 protease family protein [Hyphomicrobium sp.]HET6388833.1 site-2 protease family protein [Hyphomicrobium sp.]